MNTPEELLDQAQAYRRGNQQDDAFNALCEAIAALSAGQQQILRELADLHQDRTDVPIGGA